MTSSPKQALGARRFGLVNWLGLWTLYVREVRRFIKVITQTILAPMVTAFLFLAIFTLALGPFRPAINGVPFVTFLASGLIVMTLVQNAFANTSSSLLIAKIQGNVIDILMPPLSPGELTFGIAMGGVTRGVTVAVAAAAGIAIFVDLGLAHIWAIVYFGFMAALLMSLLGMAVGIWSEKFDHMQAMTNFVITPLTFLSGTFYSIKQLPDFAQILAAFNPFFYIIDGFRYGITGVADGDIKTGAVVLLVLNVLGWFANYWMFRTGYRLKA